MPIGVWYNESTIEDVWPEAPMNDEVRGLIVATAQNDVVEFAPELPEDATIPANYRLAQLMQARNLWNAGRTDSDGGVGDGEFVFRPFPLDRQIRQILRPKSPRKMVAL